VLDGRDRNPGLPAQFGDAHVNLLTFTMDSNTIRNVDSVTIQTEVFIMSNQSRRVAGVLLVVFPTVVLGGVSLLTLLINDPAYQDNALRQDLWRAGHAHAGVLLILSLVVLRYVDEAR